MSIRPSLDCRAVSLADVRFHITHTTDFVDTAALPPDDSHVHDCYELYIKVAGDVSFFHQKEVYALEPYDMILSRPGDVHYCLYHSSCLHDHWCLWFNGRTVAEYIDRNGLSGVVHLPPTGKEELSALLNTLNETDSPFSQTAALLQLLTLLQEKGTHEVRPTSELPLKLREILAYIETDFATIGTMDELAARFFISTPTLNRLFRKHIRLSPHKFLEAKRLACAEQLLRRGATVTEACYAAGFTDCSRFILHFKAKFGTTPYRHQRRHSGG